VRRSALAAIAGVIAGGAACDQPAKSQADKPNKLSGTLIVDGKPVTLTACRPGHTVHTWVEVVTSAGVLRFEDKQLHWQRDLAAVSPGPVLTCEKLDRKWGGGTRVDGSSYWRGWLDVRCPGPPRIEGKLTLDCGDITAEEHRQLDENQQRQAP
jgi:hypothetical protein